MHRDARAPRTWRARGTAHDPALLTAAAGVSPRVARLLLARGIADPEAADRFLRGSIQDLPDPATLPGLDAAARRLSDAVTRGELIGVHGDYDVDGVTSTAVLVETVERCGGRITWLVPDREKDGYGLQAATLDRLATRGVRLLLTCDNGTSAVAEIDRALGMGVETIVCDHHTPGGTLPRALALLNPRVIDPSGPFADLAAVGVAFLLAVALRRELRSRGWFQEGRREPNLRDLLDVVALGTVADLAPLKGVNRLLVREGLKVLAERRRPGLRALLDVARTSADETLTASTLGFRLGPRINAAGRLGDAGPAVELLLTRDPEQAARIARDLDEVNQRRQEVQETTWREAVALAWEGGDPAHRRGLVLHHREWHPGVVGVVAARLVDLFWRPVVMISTRDGVGKGSARTPPGADLYGELCKVAELFERFGGHRAAAGVTIREDRIAELKGRFENELFASVAPEDREPSILTDGELDPAEVGDELLAELSSLAPYGLGNPEPVFTATGVPLRTRRDLKAGGLELGLDASGARVRAVGFGLGRTAASIGGPVDLAFTVQENVFRGQRSVELRIRDLRTSDDGPRSLPDAVGAGAGAAPFPLVNSSR